MSDSKNENKMIADTIHGRIQNGQETLVKGWQQVLTDILTRLKPFMVPGQLVTFQSLKAHEKQFFETLLTSVDVPGHVVAVYLPPSVRHQMMYTNHPDNRYLADHDPDNPPDAGVILASAAHNFSVIMNVLFAYPPTMPAADVYDQGHLVAGYTYSSIEECQKGLTELLQTYLKEFQQQKNRSDG